MKHLRFSINRKFWFLIVLSIFLCTFPHCSNSTHHNQPPVADAGQDITLVIPADQTTASVSLDAEEWVSGLHSWQQGNDHYPCLAMIVKCVGLTPMPLTPMPLTPMPLTPMPLTPML